MAVLADYVEVVRVTESKTIACSWYTYPTTFWTWKPRFPNDEPRTRYCFDTEAEAWADAAKRFVLPETK